MAQELSPAALRRKRVRDLKAAKTPDRRRKKAHAQRMRRKHGPKNGYDWDQRPIVTGKRCG